MYAGLAFQPSQYSGLSSYGVAKTDVTGPGYPCIRQGATDQLSNGAVSLVQSKLWEAQSVPAGDSEFGTGVFGPQTDQNIRAFQSENGLDVDGIVGPLTAAKLGITEKWQSCSAAIKTTTAPVDVGGGEPGVFEKINIFRLTNPGIFYGSLLLGGLALFAGGAIFLNETGRISSTRKNRR